MMRMGSRGLLPLRPLTEIQMVKKLQDASIRFNSSGGQRIMAIRRYKEIIFTLKRSKII